MREEATKEKRTYATEYFLGNKGNNFGSRVTSIFGLNLYIFADLFAAGIDKCTKSLGANTKLRDRLDNYLSKIFKDDVPNGFLFANVIPVMICSLAIVFSVVKLPFSIYSNHQAAAGNKKLDDSIIDQAAAYVTGTKAYPTDMDAATKFCSAYIKEKIAQCEKVAAETKVERVKEIAQTLSVLDVVTLAENARGLNEATWQKEIKTKVDGVISQEIRRLGLSDTTIDKTIFAEPKPAEKTSASVDESRSEAIHSFRMKLLTERKAQLAAEARLAV